MYSIYSTYSKFSIYSIVIIKSGIIYLQQELNIIIETNPDLYINLQLINEGHGEEYFGGKR